MKLSYQEKYRIAAKLRAYPELQAEANQLEASARRSQEFCTRNQRHGRGAANADDPSIAYYIGPADSDPYREGYVGITKHQNRREREHRRSGRVSGAFSVLFRGTRRECAAVEYRYRPHRNIGLNIKAGGGRWTRKLQQNQ